MQCKTCSFFGHRSIRESNKVAYWLEQKIYDLIDDDVKRFLIGTHGEFDKVVLLVLRKVKRVRTDIEICVVFTSFNAFNKDKEGFCIADLYQDVETVIYDIEEEFYKRKITKTNEYMVKDSDFVVCYVDEKEVKSGAKRAFVYAKKLNKKVINLFGI